MRRNRQGIDQTCLFWPPNSPETDWHTALFVFLSIRLFVCWTKREKKERQSGGSEESCYSPSIWEISEAMKHGSKHDSYFYWLFEHWLCGFVGLCWLINSLGTRSPRSDQCGKEKVEVRGVVPRAESPRRLYGSQRFRVILVTHEVSRWGLHSLHT